MKAADDDAATAAAVIASPKLQVAQRPGPGPASTRASRRNTKNLTARLAADALSASCAAALIAPVISIIDRSIIENASGRASLADSLRSSLRTLLRRPHALLFSRPCALVFLLYAGTYAAANAADTAASALAGNPAPAVSAGAPKFAASSAANVALCVYKDQVFARLFGPPRRPGAPAPLPRPVALPSLALFTARDCLTIFASFNLPPLLAPHFDALGFGAHVSGATAAQFLAPAGLQLFSTPIHLLGLDLYNRPAPGPSLRSRLAAVRANWLVSALARMGRIVPAFGVGGVCNTKVRHSLMTRLE
ncbi:putative membrane protein [Escovopsis weberi]|uniref:Putative membrane protein n=1 Tax=Escovopsis weberi TaxID=150374 RepID=A0A0M9VX78_ESCWE|nr:putative membrane protein [Escovopsis weberi]